MDEHELEHRLRARLHARYDRGGPSEAFRSSLARSLTPEAARGGGFRFAISTAWPILAAAAIVVIAVAVLALRPAAVVGPGATPRATATPTASASPSGTPSPHPVPSGSPAASPSAASPSAAPASPTGTVAPVSATAWTGLDVQKLTGAPAALRTIVPWSGGYVGFAPNDATSTSTAWASRDGRSWTPLPAATFGLTDTSGNTAFLGGTACQDRVLVVMLNGSADTLWSSTDGSTWTSTPLPGDRSGTLAGNPNGSLAGTALGAITPAQSGLAVDVTTDCATWQTVRLPGPATGTVTAVAANAAGFVALGYSGSAALSNVEPLAWHSADGLHWTAAAVAAKKGDAFNQAFGGASGFVATSDQPATTPGITSMWTSADGTRWVPSNGDPLGLVDQCAGSGSVAGSFAGDGTHLLVSGPKGGCTGPLELWTSLDGAHWTKLTLTGAASAATSDSAAIGASLMRDGILFGGTAGTWYGKATNP